eukprot:COSAG03_NODE_446_length_7847_cov_4.635777_11_plen_90_part_00
MKVVYLHAIKDDILPLCALCDTLPSHYEHVSNVTSIEAACANVDATDRKQHPRSHISQFTSHLYGVLIHGSGPTLVPFATLVSSVTQDK